MIDGLLAIAGSVLKLIEAAAPVVYRAIVPGGRTVDEVIADARKAVEAIPESPAADAISDRRRDRTGGGTAG